MFLAVMFCRMSPEYDFHSCGGGPPAPAGQTGIPVEHEQSGVELEGGFLGPLKLMGSLGHDRSIHATPGE